MIKIKDSVDLNVLKNYGFEKEFDEDFRSAVWVWYDKNDHENPEELNIWENYWDKDATSNVIYHNVILVDTSDWAEQPSPMIDVLFKLISDGLVEKAKVKKIKK